MQTPTDREFPRFFEQYSLLPPPKQYDVVWSLLEKTEVSQLRRIYLALQQFLAFDIISHLPDELVERVCRLLDAPSLCRAAMCCKSWRALTNKDTLWRQLCVNECLTEYEDLPDPPPEGKPGARSLSPTHRKCPTLTLLPDTCRWKRTYLKAKQLCFNWQWGVYQVLPLMRGHRKPVISIACDGKLFVSGSSDNSARVWDVASQKCLHILENHSDAVTCVAICGGLVVTGSADSVVRIYDAESGQFIRSLKGHTSSIECMEFDGRLLVTAACDLSVRVWDVRRGVMMFTLTGHTEEPKCMSLKGCLAASGAWDNTLRVWNIHVGMCKYTLQGHSDGVFCCVFHGNRLYSGGGEGCVRGWDLSSGQQVLTLDGNNEEVYCLQVNDRYIVSGSGYSVVRVWSQSGLLLHTLRGHMGVVRCLHLDGNRLVSGGDRKAIIVWDLAAGVQMYVAHRQPTLLHLMWVDRQRIITASPDSPGLLCTLSFT